MIFKNILNVILVAITLSACTSPYRSITDADNTPINLIPMYGYPNIEKTEYQKRADEVFIKDVSVSNGSREKASKEFAGRGWYYLQQGDVENSMRRFNQSWLLDPDYYVPYWGFGVLLNTQGKAADAAPYFDKALSLIDDNDSDKPRLLADAAKAYVAQGRDIRTTDKVKSGEFFEKAKMTCSMIGSSQLTSPGKRIDLSHFSAQLPDDVERWCIGRTGTGLLILYTHPLIGQYIEKPDSRMALNAVTLMAMELGHGSDHFETTIALQNFVEKWIDRGYGTEGTGADMKVMRNRVKGFTVKRVNVIPVPRPQAHCVRYEYQMEERDNPLAPNTTMILDAYGLICQHPWIPTNIVVMGLAEQYLKGNQIDPGLFSQLKRDAALTFFDSLQFLKKGVRAHLTLI